MAAASRPASELQPPALLASLERARARQQATLRMLRPLGVVVVVLVEISGVRDQPHPGLSGEGLWVLLGLVGFAVGVLGAIRGRQWSPPLQMPFYAVLVLSSALLAWTQPGGPGVLGCFVAVSAAAMRLPGLGGSIVAGVAFVVITTTAAVGAGRSLTGVVLNGTGVIAFFVIARLAHRLREGQDQAMALLAELEQSHRAQAEAMALGERQRVAREMHDVLAHSLSGLVLQLEGARLLVERDGADGELRSAVDRALHLGKAGLTEARRAIGTLRDDELPGPDRLPALVREFESDAGVPCSFAVSGDERALRSEARLTLYRVAQEALTNVRRHARPRAVAVHLAYEPGGARLTVEDFGDERVPQGAPHAPGADHGGGYGITGMRERAELLGGRLDAVPTERGFRVELWVPA